MNRTQTHEYYGVQVYNSFNEYPIAMTNIEDFSFNSLLSHSSPNVRKFNFIVIIKYTESGSTTTVEPKVVIYDSNAWDVKLISVEDIYQKSRMMTHCYNGKESLDFNGKLNLFSCHNQAEIIEIFDRESQKLTKSKEKRKSLFRSVKKHNYMFRR